MKSKQDLKKVFENGDKPKQEDFWEWQDSYWHKEESIPKEKIEGIPPNLATVDITTETENIEGTVNTKEQVDEKITSAINNLKNNVPATYDTLKEIADWISNDETAEAAILQTIQNETTARVNADNTKLDKPTIISNPASYPYVVGENGNGGSARLPAGDLGKNFFNSDLSNTTARNHTMNAAITIDTLGYAYKLKGLADKTGDDSFNKVIKTNPVTGDLALGNALQINMSVADPITVNHIYPNTVPDMNTYPQDIRIFAQSVKTLSFTKILPSDWLIYNNSISGLAQIIDNKLYLKTSNIAVAPKAPVCSGILNKSFPTNKNWAIRLFVNWIGEWNYQDIVSIGIVQSDDISSMITANQVEVELTANTNNCLARVSDQLAYSSIPYGSLASGQIIILHSNNVLYIVIVTPNGNYARKLFTNADVLSQQFRLNCLLKWKDVPQQRNNAIIDGDYYIES